MSRKDEAILRIVLLVFICLRFVVLIIFFINLLIVRHHPDIKLLWYLGALIGFEVTYLISKDLLRLADGHV